MPREVIEYRAVGVDRREEGGLDREELAWHRERDDADNQADMLRGMKMPYDDVFLERRVTVFGEPERVEEGEQ